MGVELTGAAAVFVLAVRRLDEDGAGVLVIRSAVLGVPGRVFAHGRTRTAATTTRLWGVLFPTRILALGAVEII
jgi:hypothetical protein